jgi:hypothetical protein
MNFGRVRTVLLLVALPLALLLFGAVDASAKTKVKTYHAWTSDGEPTVSSWSHRDGDCNSSSFVNTQGTAWRCFVGNNIYDPCFESPLVADEVMCVLSPWSRRGILLQTSLDPADRFPVGGHRAWALQLVSGRRCVFVSGASNDVRGKRLNYVCGLHSHRAPSGPYLFGFANRHHSTWTIIQARNFKGDGWTRRRIRIAWR